MNKRIDYLKTITRSETEDIKAYQKISQIEYINIGNTDEIFRKSHFLSCFAKDIPIILDENELICGSMRFWRERGSARNKGHIIVDYRMILHEGICGIKEKITKLDTREAKAFCEVMEAFSTFVERYAKAADDLYHKNGTFSGNEV